MFTKIFKLLLLPVILSVIPFCVKQTVKINPYMHIDNYALNTPGNMANSLQDLAEYLAANCTSDKEKARVLYRWITDNIYYDTDLDQDSLTGLVLPETVLQKRTAVCSGYARLYKSLSDELGLTVVEIDGFVKGSNYTPGDSFKGPYNHSWITVLIDSCWQFLDPTWGSGYINEKGEYVHEFNDYYFLIPPEELIYSHFPASMEWQLLDNTVTLREFENMVFLKDVFFKNNLKLKSHVTGTIRAGDNVHIELEVPVDIQLLSALVKDGQLLPEKLIKQQRIGDICHLYITLTGPGNYFLRIFTKRKKNRDSYNLTMVYKIISDKS